MDLFILRKIAQSTFWFSLSPPLPLCLDTLANVWPMALLYAFLPTGECRKTKWVFRVWGFNQIWSFEDHFDCKSSFIREWGFNDGKVKLYQQLLWQVELSQLAKEVQPLLGLSHNGVCVIVPLQVLGDGGAQEAEWLHCSHSTAHDGEWGEGFSWSPRSSPLFWAC